MTGPAGSTSPDGLAGPGGAGSSLSALSAAAPGLAGGVDRMTPTPAALRDAGGAGRAVPQPPPGVVFPLRVELPRGQYALLRDPEDVPERLRRPVSDAAARSTALLLDAGITEAEISAAESGDTEVAFSAGLKAARAGLNSVASAVMDHLIVALVQEWSYEHPLTIEGVRELPGRAFHVLAEACTPFRAALSPDFGPNPDPASPITPSSG